MNESFMAINDEGRLFNFQLSRTEHHADIKEYLTTLAQQVEQVVKFDQGLYLSSIRGTKKVAMRIYEMFIKTDYIAADDMTEIKPNFRANEESVFAECSFKTPDDMALFFVKSNANIFLVAFSLKEKKLYTLPLPNIYVDGLICMGDSYLNDPTASIVENCNAALEVFKKAEWNRDLIGNSSAEARDLFWRWDLETKEHKGFPENWEDYCRTITSDEYNDLMVEIGNIEGWLDED